MPNRTMALLLAALSAGPLACTTNNVTPAPPPTTCANAAADTSHVMDTLAVQQKPRMRLAGSTRYPVDNLGRRWPGAVTLAFIVGADGRAEQSSIGLDMATDSSFVAPAVHAVLESRWWPACLNGRRVPVQIHLVIRFNPGPWQIHQVSRFNPGS